MKRIIRVVILFVHLILMAACIVNPGDNSEEVNALQQEISLLETQNALLQDGSDNSAPSPPTNSSQSEVEIVSPEEELLPSSPIQAGVPIVYGGWSMTVSQELTIFQNDDYWGITIYIRNMGDVNRIFRFTNSGVTAKDNLGNVYEMANPWIGSIAGVDGLTCEESHYSVKNLEVGAGESEEIRSASGGYHRCTKDDGLHMFEGPFPISVSSLILHFEDFGPFSGVDVVIDL